MRRLILVTSIAIGGIIASFGCGGTSAGPTSEGTAPISIEALDGETGVGTDSTFQYGFDKAVDTSTAEANFFIMLASAGECNSANAISASVSCSSSTICTLTPSSDLTGGTSYTICLTTDIMYDDGTAFEGFSATFSTEGEAPSTPSVSSVTDAASTPNTIETTGSTGIIPTSFKITFSEAMAEASVTTADNITLTCADMPSSVEQPSITVALSADDADNGVTGDEYTVTVTDADGNSPYKFQMMTCTLTVATNVTNSGGTALAAAATYVFTNGCALDDDFNADSSSCWTVLPSATVMEGFGGVGWDDWDGLLGSTGILSFDTTNSELDYNASDATADLSGGSIYKVVTVNSEGFEIVAHFTSITEMGVAGSSVELMLTENAILNAPGQACGKNLKFGIGYNTQVYAGRICLVTYGPACNTTGAVWAVCDGSEYYLKLNVTSSAITGWYSTDGQNYDPINTAVEGYDLPTDQDFTDTPNLSLQLLTNSATRTVVSIGSIEVTGLTSTDQY